MNWWEEAEARARRAKGPAAMAPALSQRLLGAGLDPELTLVPAHDLARLYHLCADLVHLVDGLLITADGDVAAIRRQGLLLSRWAEETRFLTESSAPAFNQMMDSLDLEPDTLAAREEVRPAETSGVPEEQAKVAGRYRLWHLLFERIDLKLASVGMAESIHQGLARSLSRIYEEALVAVRLIGALERDTAPRFRAVARILLEVNTTWHFDLGPNHLGHGRLRPGLPVPQGLQTWLLLAFANPGFASGPKP